MAVLCLLSNTPWPWPTPAEAASARGGFPTRIAMEGAGGGLHKRERGRLGCLLSRARGRASQQVCLPCLAQSAWNVSVVPRCRPALDPSRLCILCSRWRTRPKDPLRSCTGARPGGSGTASTSSLDYVDISHSATAVILPWYLERGLPVPKLLCAAACVMKLRWHFEDGLALARFLPDVQIARGSGYGLLKKLPDGGYQSR
jgi:hypothetical protein